MISFITISRDPDKVAGLQENLETVFGKSQPWELLVADGSQLDIFEGYNQMAAEAKGDCLAFTHDDVSFMGNQAIFEKPIQLMEKPMTGIIGAAGATTMPREGCWWKSNQLDCRGAVYHPSSQDPTFGMHLNCWPHLAARFGSVVVVDGVLLMCSRRTFTKLDGFDSQTFQGFHFYDTDLSLRSHLLGLQNYVAPIPLLHRSHGQTNDNWEQNRVRFVEKHKSVLPAKL